jgi:hypothetical protein
MALTDADRARLLVGRDELPPAPRRFHLGALSFDLDGIDVRQVVIDGREVVNRIYVGVRDTDWDTLPPTVTGLDVRTRPDGSVAITFEAVHNGSGIDYRWRGAIEATTAGDLTYEMDGEARADFRHNRIGFCVLHPASVAGRSYRAVTPDGTVSGTFSELIAPQEVVDGQEVALFPAFSSLAIDFDGLEAVAAFEGDLFEVEDQRNWTDASFKTYCTPISLGYPHTVRRGLRIRQRVTLTTEPRGAAHAPPHAGNGRSMVDIASGGEGSWPQLGLGSATGPGAAELPRSFVRRLRALALDHIRVDLRLNDRAWATTLDHAFADADALGCRLEVALFVAESSLGELAQASLRLSDPRVARVIALHEPTAGTGVTPQSWFQAVDRELASASDQPPPVFTGTDGDFAELNRDRPVGGAAGVAYALNPQVHASDDASILETLPIQGLTVATARSFASGAVAVSPITLRGRFNPAAAEPHGAGFAEPPADPRQASLLAAGWTLGSIASIVAAGADSVTWFETVGPRGVLGPGAAGSPAAGNQAGAVYPVWFVLADLADRAGWRPVQLATPASVTGLAMRRSGRIRVLLANLGRDPVRLNLGGWSAHRVRVRILDAEGAPAAMAGPTRFVPSGEWHASSGGRLDLELGPYAYARLDARHRPAYPPEAGKEGQ